MTTSTAYVQRERNGKQVLLKDDVQLPSREAHQSLVKVQYVAQNPTDGIFCSEPTVILLLIPMGSPNTRQQRIWRWHSARL